MNTRFAVIKNGFGRTPLKTPARPLPCSARRINSCLDYFLHMWLLKRQVGGGLCPIFPFRIGPEGALLLYRGISGVRLEGMTMTEQAAYPPFGWPKGVGFACLAAATLFQIMCAMQPVAFLVDVIFTRDDAFYYFQLAHNIAQTGQASFDGLHAANGVQLLWQFILAGLAQLIPDKEMFLYGVLGLCIALNVIVALVLWDLAGLIFGRFCGDIALILWAGVMVERANTLQGMEFSLHVLVVLVVLRLFWMIWQSPGIRPGLFALLGLMLTLQVWARLDGALLSLALWGVALWLLWVRAPAPQTGLAALTGLTLIPLLGAGLYFWTAYMMAGTFVPISGSVKQHYASVFFEGVEPWTAWKERIKWGLKIQSLIPSSLLPDALYRLGTAQNFNLSNWVHMALPVIVSAIVLGGAVWLWRYSKPVVVAGLGLWGVSVLHTGLSVMMLGDFSHVSGHYYGVLLVFWLLWSACLLSVLRDVLAKLGQGALSAAILLGVLGFGAHGVAFLTGYEEETENYALVRMRLAPELNESLPADARVGAWNAGVLGYFLDRPVVGLDGLINDRAFLERLKAGAPLQPYLRETGITHLIDHNARDLTLKFQEMRDTQTEFRDGITWDEVEVLDKRHAIYVLEVKG